MKIYVSASIRGGRYNKKNVLKIVNRCKLHGNVLDEHVGDQKMKMYGVTGTSNREQYERDSDWLNSADVMVTDVTVASLGVGREIEMAKSLHIKNLILCKTLPKYKRVSAMVSGDPDLEIFYYRDDKERDNIIDSFFVGLKSVYSSSWTDTWTGKRIYD